MTKTEQFKQKQAEMTDKELHDLVRTELSKLCITGGKSLTICVPPMVTDTDMLISELLNRFKRLTNGVVGSYDNMEQKIIDWFELNWAKVFVSKPDNYTVDIDTEDFAFIHGKWQDGTEDFSGLGNIYEFLYKHKL